MRTPLAENTVINNRYVVQKTINSKTINQINYLCVDQTNGQVMLIKEFFPLYAARTENGDLEYSRLPDDAMDKFVFSNKNTQIYGKLPTISPVVDIFTANNTAYAVCEYYKGKTVRELVAEGRGFSKTTVQNVIVMLLKTNMTLAKFGLCNRNFHPDNVVVTEDGYIKLREFCPEKLDVYEGESTKSIAALGFFMMTGKDTEMAPRVRKHKSTPRERQLIDYMLYVVDETSTVTSKEFYNAALLRFDKRAIFNSGSRVEAETDRKIFGIFAKKRFAALALIIASVVVALCILAAFRFSIDFKKKADLGFKSLVCTTDFGKDELTKDDFSSVNESLFTKKYEYTFEDTNITSKEMKIKLSLETPETTKIQWEYNGKQQKESDNKTEITIKPSDNNREVILTLKNDLYGMNKEIYVVKFTSIKDIVVYTHNSKEDKGVELTDFDFTVVSDGGVVIIPADTAYVSFEANTGSEMYTVSIEHDGKKAEAGELISLDSGSARITFSVYKNGEITETRIYRFEIGSDKGPDASKVHKIPDLVGMSYDEAVKKLVSIGMNAERKEELSSKKENQVLKQSQKKDTELPEGTTVVLTVSSNTIVIPNVVYKEEAVAKRLITESGAKVTVTYESNNQVKSGNVISQSITGKSTYGKTVNLMVSNGIDNTEIKPEEKKAEEEKVLDSAVTSNGQQKMITE